MSTAGIYNNWVKVTHPNTVFPQMESGEYQKPFYFGASQVPINLGVEHNPSMKSHHKDSLAIARSMDVKGRGIRPHFEKHNRIVLTKNFKK